jgi:thiamine biosynthesis lipoprotein
MQTVVADHRWHAMGTSCHVMVHGEHRAARSALAAAVATVTDLESKWSRFLPDSELCAINRGAGGPVAVSPTTLRAVQEALTARDTTGGWFDPTILHALEGAGYDRDFTLVAAASSSSSSGRGLTAPGSRGGAAVEVNLAGGTVTVAAGSAVDLGGIGKGLAADLTAEAVAGMTGVVGVCVNLGGDLRALGDASGVGGWGITVEDPARPERTIATIALAAGGLATSSTGKRRWRSGATDLHHLIDPHTGQPAGSAVRSVTVLAGTGAAAEALATAAIVAGADAGVRLLEEAGAPALLVEDHLSRSVGAMADFLR